MQLLAGSWEGEQVKLQVRSSDRCDWILIRWTSASRLSVLSVRQKIWLRTWTWGHGLDVSADVASDLKRLGSTVVAGSMLTELMTQLRRELLLAGYSSHSPGDDDRWCPDLYNCRKDSHEQMKDKVENKLIYLRLLLRRTHSFGRGAALLPALATPDNSKQEGLLSQRSMSSYYATNTLSW